MLIPFRLYNILPYLVVSPVIVLLNPVLVQFVLDPSVAELPVELWLGKSLNLALKRHRAVTARPHRRSANPYQRPDCATHTHNFRPYIYTSSLLYVVWEKGLRSSRLLGLLSFSATPSSTCATAVYLYNELCRAPRFESVVYRKLGVMIHVFFWRSCLQPITDLWLYCRCRRVAFERKCSS